MPPRQRTRKVSDKEITEQHIEKLNEDHSKELEAAREKIKELEERATSHKAQIDRNVEAYLKLQEKNNELSQQNSNLSNSELVLSTQLTKALEMHSQCTDQSSTLVELYEAEIARLQKRNKLNFIVLGTIAVINLAWTTYLTFIEGCH
jgi:hypothetical protein